jgi:hypothetical protein
VGLAASERDGDGEAGGAADGERLARGARRLSDGEGVASAGDRDRLVEDDSGSTPRAVTSAVIGSARGGS